MANYDGAHLVGHLLFNYHHTRGSIGLRCCRTELSFRKTVSHGRVQIVTRL